MKKLQFFLLLFFFCAGAVHSQITTANLKAAFGIDGELRAPFLGPTQFPASMSHDWFTNSTGTQRFMIDTTGAAYYVKRCSTDVAFRRLPFFRTMRYPALSILDGRRLIDAVYIRDYHGSDSTVFASSNKNGGSPGNWTGAIEGNIPQKNDILDIMVHVRRSGSSNFHTVADSLFFIGGIAIDATSGSRYFDFELYQTDIYYDRATQKFTGFGPDAGHTSWQFDATTGAVTVPGDVIFSAEFGGSGLQDLVARIWVHRDALLINSPNFDWDGSFDGDNNGATYGYAGIRPKNGKNFYLGLQNTTATWGGPYKVIRRDDSMQDTYDANQFLEFSVNMGTLGLDPINLLGGGSQCDMPFRRILVKTRSSASFTAELKDFVGPFDFFNFDATDAFADIPMICGDETVSTLSVINPLPSSIYTWSTPDGNIISDTNGYSITVDTPGTYIVRQQLLNGCNIYSQDTVLVMETPNCGILPVNRIQLSGKMSGEIAQLNLDISSNEQVEQLIVEQSVDGKSYSEVKSLFASNLTGYANYKIDDDIRAVISNQVFYRVKILRKDGTIRYSNSIRLNLPDRVAQFQLFPNPVRSSTSLSVVVSKNQLGTIKIFNAVGALMQQKPVQLVAGLNTIMLDGFGNWSNGIYPIQLIADEQVMTQKLILSRKK
ncbi:T9SS type A sorting domain-containing protein [Flavihumibacter cheonanensis]|uniref:T9SS type A sorting domain-containing protein n=1 Tax=Flavihumibacter cheonanensis TaxID=1442385 RepID=UPI001EF8B9C1|nr:T9SS type A sorting domain-containing protein [Flavihumibacter cheonanensis]MCG7751859.1 T9SS type A sorting domain-containing protein [Flavihumibacter cheonanensis]